MYRGLLIFSLSMLIWIPIQQAFSAGDSAHATNELEAGGVNPGYFEKPDWFKDSFLDIREDIEEATAEGRRLLLYFHQDGCPYCKKLLTDNFGDHGIAEKTRKGFDVIAVNMWGDREVTGLNGEVTTEKDFSKSLRVQYTPTLLFLDEAGEVLVRINGYFPPHRFSAVLDYVASRKESEISVRDYLATTDPQPAKGVLHREAWYLPPDTDLSVRDASRPLLVMFEQKQCPACDELHGDFLQREAVRESFRQFDVLLLDIWSEEKLTTPQGDYLSAKQWAEKLKIQYAPTLLFLDADGTEQFRTEAYLRAFHTHGALDYVLSGAWYAQPEFQRFLQERRTDFERRGLSTDLWE